MLLCGTLSFLEANHSVLKDHLSKIGLPIYTQDKYLHRTNIDMRGEHTI